MDTYVCANCVGDKDLKNEIHQQETRECSYCDFEGPVMSVVNLAAKVEEVLRTQYAPGEEYRVPRSDHDWKTDWAIHGALIEEIVGELVECEEELTNDILAELGPTSREISQGEEDLPEYMQNREIDSWYREQEWNQYRDDLTKRKRFFHNPVESVFQQVHDDILRIAETHNQEVIRVLPSNKTKVNRARTVQRFSNAQELLMNPTPNLGPPPHNKAMAGRMNPHGIQVFYGAMEVETAIQEVRPVPGSYVITGSFRLLKEVKVLDLPACRRLKQQNGPFHPNHYEDSVAMAFLRKIEDEVSKTVLPEDEALDYILTQAFAEFLAGKGIDGIIYRSALQPSGENLVLFHHAAKVQVSDKEQRMEIKEVTIYQDSGSPIIWSTPKEQPPQADIRPRNLIEFSTKQSPQREPTLELELDSIFGWHVESSPVTIKESGEAWFHEWQDRKSGPPDPIEFDL